MSLDVLVSAAVSEALVSAVPHRPLGSRGSRGDVDENGPDDLTPTATAVLAAIPAWWKAQASAAGLTGRWLDVEQAIGTSAPIELPTDTPLGDTWGSLTPDQVGATYVQQCAPLGPPRPFRGPVRSSLE